ncbi:cytochrome P450 [Kordiimonas pumila]|uniref:Cytochrome P450 n=1 Tax=Kordiimonas pumila TaxID=2161677 RepID=A0ABV7D4I5_9PROT|nr:cytochrome P450 [Kordiimonas pumila]
MSVSNIKTSNSPTNSTTDWWGTITDHAFITTPFPTLHELLKEGPIHHDTYSDIYFILGHAEFQQIMKSPDMRRDTRLWKDGWNTEEYRAKDPVGFELLSGNQPQIINNDGADHKRMRDVYTPAFRAQMMKNLSPMIEAECGQLLNQLPVSEPVDFVKAVAGPLPLRVMCNLFDIPSTLDEEIGRWSAAIIRLADILLTDAQKEEALDAQNNFKAYLKEEIAIRRHKDGNSLMDMAIKALDNGTMTEEETLINLMSMVLAGHETTVSLLGSGMYLLLKNPDQRQKLHADRSLMHKAIEEMLRVEPSGTMILRIAAKECEIGGTKIPEGAMVMGMISATNYDPRRYENPFVFDITRTPNPHQTFGGGPHVCIGAPLSRLEASIVFSSILDKFSKIEFAGKPEWRLDRLNARGLASLPIQVEAN